MKNQSPKAKAANMGVTIIDSEPSVVALIDHLDHLPTQPPSLYLDIEGVNLSRHGSISIVQLLILPMNHVFLIDVFVLGEKAFCTSNRSGTDLRSILESALVPKVFFDLRNDSDALFAHFQISLQGIHDVQLLEVATRSHSKDRLAGLTMCIKKDAQLTHEVSAAWKATKQKGLSHFAPKHGGSYEVFTYRPMLQDIIDYCTQDVLYLPLLWKIYSRKISTKWTRKVQDETCKRIRVSQTASYEPHGKNKTLSPWANPAKSAQVNRPGNTGARGLGKKAIPTVAQIAATEAAKKIAATQPDAKPQSQPSVGEADPQWSPRLAALKIAQKTPETTAELERPRPKLDLPIRSQDELEGGSQKRTNPTLYPATVYSKWTCITCGREMQEDQREKHLAGKQHKARLGKWTCIICSREMPEDEREKHLAGKQHIARAKRAATAGSKAAVPESQQRGIPYPPDHIFSGFRGSVVPRNLQYETAFFLEDAGVNYGLCDKDCGWCGHCMDGVDI